MHFVAALIMMVSAVTPAVTPARTWYPPTQPLTVDAKAEGDARLVLTDFSGKPIDSKAPAVFNGAKTFDLKELWPELAEAGTYVLFLIHKDQPLAKFEGTPLVIEVRADRKSGMPAAAEVTRVGPLEYVVMTTDEGPMTMMFYYDVAPLTAASFLNLSRTGYYEKTTFHRILPSFVIQGGDPKGDGTGGPGYHVEAEFNDRPHLEGVLSMARQGDPAEAEGAMPRCEFANSAGSQFFVCLDYAHTQSLDHKYTVFGRVVQGMDTVKKIAGTPLADPRAGKPVKPPMVVKTEVKSVTATDNPYAELFHFTEPAK